MPGDSNSSVFNFSDKVDIRYVFNAGFKMEGHTGDILLCVFREPQAESDKWIVHGRARIHLDDRLTNSKDRKIDLHFEGDDPDRLIAAVREGALDPKKNTVGIIPDTVVVKEVNGNFDKLMEVMETIPGLSTSVRTVKPGDPDYDRYGGDPDGSG